MFALSDTDEWGREHKEWCGDTPGAWPARQGSGQQRDMMQIWEQQYNHVEQAYSEPASQRLELCKIIYSHFLLSLSTFYIVPPLLSYLLPSSEEQLQVHWFFVLVTKMKWNMTNYYLLKVLQPHNKTYVFIIYIFEGLIREHKIKLLFILCREFLFWNFSKQPIRPRLFCIIFFIKVSIIWFV